jgi:hypothetical protein
MPLRTFTTAGINNLFSNPANWTGGIVPLDTDTWIIPVGQTCDCDATQAAFGTGCGGTINGVLQAWTGAGSWTLKLSAALTGTGTLRAGTSLVPYPSTCTFTIVRNNFEITATNLTLDLNCTEPSIKHVHLTGAEGIGSTVLDVDASVVGVWNDGDLIRIDDVNGYNSELRTIAVGGIAAGTITITAGLTNAKIVGAYVILISRNVKITHTAATTNGINGGTNGRIGAEIRGASLGVNLGTGHTISGTVSGCSNNGVNGGTGHTISGTVSGCSNNGVNGGTGHTISGTVSGCSNNGVNGGTGHTISGTVSGCYIGVNLGTGFIISGTVSGCGTGIYRGTGKFLGATFSGNTTSDIYFGSGIWTGYASLNSGAQVVYNDDLPAYPALQQIAIWDIGGVAGAYKSWMRGGRVQSQAVVVPTGRVVGYQHICESASYPVFMDRYYEVEPNKTINVTAWLRKDALMAYLPRVQLFRIENDPLLGRATLDAETMTNSLNTWEQFALTWINTTVGPVTVVVRTIAQNAANNVYADTFIEGATATAGGGGSPFRGVFG